MRSHETKIVAVGGGLSGLNFVASASAVLGEGTKVSLIETRNKSGGRTIRSMQPHSPMQELGAFFVYDKDVHDQLISIGAQVRLLADDDFFIVRDGAIQPCGKTDGPFGIVDTIAGQLAQLPHNISIELALSENETFKNLSPSMQRIVTTILESDLAASLDKVGVSSLRFDGQTVVNGSSVEDPMFGICLREGFSSLARDLRKQFGGETKYSVHLEGVGIDAGNVTLHLVDKKSTQKFCEKADKLYLGLPLPGLQELMFFEDGVARYPLTDKLSENQRRAVSMLDMGDAIKITVPIRECLIPGKDLFNITLDPPPDCAIRCGELWGLPMPSYADKPADTPSEHNQIIMMYLGGTQALDLRNRLVEAKRAKANLPKLLNHLVKDYLEKNLGISPERVGKVHISMWLNRNGGRGAYSYIKADNQPSDFNPRAQFTESPFGMIHIGGSAFSEEEPTLTGGAQASAQVHLEEIQRERDKKPRRAAPPDLTLSL